MKISKIKGMNSKATRHFQFARKARTVINLRMTKLSSEIDRRLLFLWVWAARVRRLLIRGGDTLEKPYNFGAAGKKLVD